MFSRANKYIILLINLLLTTQGFSQDTTPPDRPLISYVTVDTTTGNTHVFWTESESEDIKWYYLYYEIETINGLEGIRLDSIRPGNSTWTDMGKADSKPLIYSISAIDSSGNECIRTPGYHSTVYVSARFDSCNHALELTWNRYNGWGENLSGYRIYLRESGKGYPPPSGVSKEDTLFRFENIKENTPYLFFIESIKNDTLISSSNLGEKFTYMPGPPESLELINTDASDPSVIKIIFEYTDTSGINSFCLLRAKHPAEGYVKIRTINDLSPGINTFTDSVNTSGVRYFYSIGAENSCGHIIDESNTGTNILLTGISKDDQNLLSWTDYQEWEAGVEEYQVLLLQEEGNPDELEVISPGTLQYTHNLGNLPANSRQGILSYQIIAKERDKENYSYSNILTLEINSRVSIPNAFTPNNDGKNDTFRPLFSVLPGKFLMIIYDRYGKKVFETSNPTEGWNGKTTKGTPAMEGVYMYYIQYSSYTGTQNEQTGRVTLFYPD